MSLVIIDYDAGNTGSVLNAFKYLKLNAILSDNINELKESDGIILPGVGSFDAGIRALKKKNLFSVVRELIERGKPYLGICLGLQMIFKGSDEGEEQGFSIFPGMIKKFDSSRVKDSKNNFKITQVGWNQIEIKKKSPILENITDLEYFYFVHSYYAPYDNEDWVGGISNYIVNYVSLISEKNIFATQFHPEKSQKAGLQILKNFGNYVYEKKTTNEHE